MSLLKVCCDILVYKPSLFVCRVVEFSTYGDMRNALDKLDNTEINGRKIKLVEDKPRRSSRRR